ncbi:MAG: hypothetical protein IT360_15460 [Gemmatimonadaceae bacterium]|nr:hypothetical protein [Gemmatimonadaceae bacterium]
MFKLVFLLLLGFAAGYSYGFKDSKDHDEDVVTRTIERIGGSSRGKYNQDLDAQLQRVENR